MAFQRSYSKVWWGSDNQLPTSSVAAGSGFANGSLYAPYFSLPHQQHSHQQQQQQQQFGGGGSGGSGYHSLDYNCLKSYSGNLSRIQEVDDEQNISKLSWEKHDSPGSLRSQDSGFSDNDESHSTRSLGGRSSHTASPSSKSVVSAEESVNASPASVITIATPPTVIPLKRRVGKSEFYTPLVSVSRRISFSGSPPQAEDKTDDETDERSTLMSQLDEMQLDSEESPQKVVFNGKDTLQLAATKPYRRRRKLVRQATKPLSPTKRRILIDQIGESDDDSDSSPAEEQDLTSTFSSTISLPPAYNNETVYLGEAPQAYNNETVILGGALDVTDDTNNNTLTFDEHTLSPLRDMYTVSTSTPKATAKSPPRVYRYENPLLNGHMPALQRWLKDQRMSYEHEVMSTLQTKSIAQEAFRNFTITTSTVAKLIRQLQQRALYLQSDFERIERILSGALEASLHEALCSAEQLVDNVIEFSKVLERRSVFFADSRVERKKYEEYIEQIRIITRDTRYSLEKQHYINLESLLDDVLVLKRYLLITIRLVFEKMVHVIVQNIEHGTCDLMLRANINMIATLSNIDYEGFASLTDAFVRSEAVRTLLIICLDHRLSSVRALALRALATVCCAPAAIHQFGVCDGLEILREILQVPQNSAADEMKRTDVERREAVSLLTQITAVWHGPEHRVAGLKQCVESIVEGLTHIVRQVSCPQTLLLCAAALNNLSRIEITSHYSIMSNEAIYRFIETLGRQEQSVSIFLYEQVVAMLHNMSLNKKCHSHLANGSIINFITSAYQAEFYKRYDSRAESDAQRRTVKAILHTLNRLVNESSLGAELLEQQRLPEFFKMALAAGGDLQQQPHTQFSLDSSHGRDISMLVRQLLAAQKQERAKASEDSSTGEQDILHADAGERELDGSGMKFNLTRQESYV